MQQQFLLLSTFFLGLILNDFGQSSSKVEGKTTFAPFLNKLEGNSTLGTGKGGGEIKNKKTGSDLQSSTLSLELQPVSLAQVQNDASGDYTGMSMTDLCIRFTNGSRSEFYSPMYPFHYPNNTDCYRTISAGPGQFIRIKFLDHFHIEYAEHCEYDYLEIRDGLFGYSTLIQKICGTSPPTYIQSSGRHLWLRFHSDTYIQYIGFKAMYEFLTNPVPPPHIEECAMLTTRLNDSIASANISADFISKVKRFEAPIDCTWMIQAEEAYKIQLNFEAYELEKPNDCTFNFIEIYESLHELTNDRRMKQYCGSKAEGVTSKGNVLYIRFFSHIDLKASNPDLKSKFAAYYNFFREGTPQDPCRPPLEHDCSDNTCIDASLICNGKPDCKLRNDEENCQKSETGEARTDIAMIASLGCVLIIGMCGGLFLNIYRKLQQDRAELIELKDALQKSRESMLTAQNQSVSAAPNTYATSPQTYGSSPQISSHESADSKDTVLEKPTNGLKRHSNGIGFRPVQNNEDSSNENGDYAMSGQSGGDPVSFAKPSAPPVPSFTSTASGPVPSKGRFTNGGESRKPLRVQADINPNSIVYSPPPPYPSGAANPRSQLSIRGTDSRKEFFPPGGDDTPEREHPGELCIEVRDSACQTKDSFLAQMSQRQDRNSVVSRKAPLARSEAIDTFDMSTSMPKRMAKISKMQDFPSHVSVTSTSSTGTDRMGASLGSLENIDEYHE